MAPGFDTVDVGTKGPVDGKPGFGDVETSMAVMLLERNVSDFEAASIVEDEPNELGDGIEISFFEANCVFAAALDTVLNLLLFEATSTVGDEPGELGDRLEVDFFEADCVFAAELDSVVDPPVFEATSIVGDEPGELCGILENGFIEASRVFAIELDAAPDSVDAEPLRSRERRLWIMDESDPVNETAVAPITKVVLHVNVPENESRSWPSNELTGHALAEELVADVVVFEDEVLAGWVLADVMLATPDAEAVRSRKTRV